MYQYEFRWIDWNLEKIEKHDVRREEAEYIVCHAASPYPRRIEDAKRLVWGQTPAGRYLQVIYLVDPDKVVFVIHARPLSESEKWQYRRRRQ